MNMGGNSNSQVKISNKQKKGGGSGSVQGQQAGNYYMYRGGDELKLKLQQLREGMGYYDGKSGNGGSVLEKPSHVPGHHSNNNSLLLPELKSMVPQL